MHRLTPLLLSALALAGCATSTPVAEQGERFEFASATTPHNLAFCAAHNARAFPGPFTSDAYELLRPDNFRVIVTHVDTWRRDTIIVGRAAPVPGGAQIVLYLSPGLGNTERADWIARLRNGCESEIRTASVVPVVPREALPAFNPPPPPVPASPPPPARQPRG